ncbi:MAG: rane protein [Proteobacteria bacterium]|nr:rane protein [Pseudomonadota bacterium]
MRIFFALFVLWSCVNASNLLTYNVYERSDRVDIMLSFDAPHEGGISQKNDATSITLTINDLGYDKMIEKSINSNIIQELTIIPEKNNTLKVVLKSDKKVSVVASKTVDGFGLRIRSSIMQAPVQSASETVSASSLPATASSTDFVDTRYIIVIVILLFLVVLMLWIKKRLGIQTIKPASAASNGGGKSWLFNPKTGSQQEVNVLHKKQIDNQNSVVLFEYGTIKYLVMTGNSNVLLEKFQNGEVKDDNDFEKVFEENRRRLDDYLKLQDNKLSTYKNKASADYTPIDEMR